MVFENHDKLSVWRAVSKARDPQQSHICIQSNTKPQSKFNLQHPLSPNVNLFPFIYQPLTTLKDCVNIWMELELAFICRAACTGDLLVRFTIFPQ
jgi:hypothetical protein